MGTNYYWADLLERLDDDKKYDRKQELDCHIGKRSAAGYYCFDCRVSLCKDGEGHVHGFRYGEHIYGSPSSPKALNYTTATAAERFNNLLEEEANNWWKACPICNKAPNIENLTNSSAGRELGFNKSDYIEPKGVSSCSSFTWGISPHKVYRDIAKQRRPIVDEYGHTIRPLNFIDMLYCVCPIQFYDCIGLCFS